MKISMRLLFDLTMVQPLDGTKFHGGGKYGEIVFKQLLQTKAENIAGYYNKKRYINPELIQLIKSNSIPLYDCNKISLEEAAIKEGKVIYSPIFGRYLFSLRSDIKIIATIHGLRNLELPEDKFQYEYLQKRSKISTLLLKYGADHLKRFLIRNGDFYENLKGVREIGQHKNIHFVTVSGHSKNSLLAFVPSLEHKDIQVYYSPSTFVDTPEIPPFCKEKYYLLVSGNRWQKNAIRAFIAFDELFSERPEFEGKVFVTGLSKGDFLRYQIKNIDRFKFLGYVEEHILKSLYKGAYLFVYPTLNEGFGYPPLEAMAERCPVITSAIASVPEICGDSVNYFNPFSVVEIKMRILEMEDVDKRNVLISRGVLRQMQIEKQQKYDLELLADHIFSFVV